MEHYLVMDVGGSHIKYALMTPDNILEKGDIVTPQDNSDHLIESLSQLYEKYKDQIKGIALSVPGRIDTKQGIMHTGGYLAYIDDFPLVKALSQRCPVKISIENDGKCAALAELWKGSLQGIQQGVVIVLGTGIGGGIIVNGELVRGHRYAAGELSWLPVSMIDMGYQEPFMWSHLCGTMGLTDVYERDHDLPHHSISGKQFFELVNQGDQSALAILNQFAKSFAIGVMSIQAVLDTQVIAVGGGISAQPILIEVLQKAVDALFDQYQSMPIDRPKIVRCTFANDSNLYGALYHHLKD